MSITDIRTLLERQQASIRLVDGKLALRGPGGALKDSELITLIKAHREELLARLAAGEAFEYEQAGEEAIPANLLQPDMDTITPDLLPLLDISQEEIDVIVASVDGGAAAIQDIYPLTPLQEGMLFHYMMADKGDPYLIWSVYSFADRQTLDTFVDAFNTVVARHDILRTCLRWERLREPVQVVLREARVAVEDVALDPRDGCMVEQMKAKFSPSHYRLDLRDPPLVKLLVARDDQNDRLVVMQLLHHLTTDRTTGDVVTSEVMAIMAGQAHTLPQPVPYRNFVAHVKSVQDDSQHETFFKNLLGNVEHTTAPFGLLNVHRDGSGIIERSMLVDEDVSTRLSRLARAQGISATSILHVAWAHVLGRVCSTDSPVFGTVMFGRMKAGGSNERILGLSINTLPVTLDATTSVRVCVRGMQILLAELLHHEHAPLTVTQKASKLPSGVPLFTSVINYRHSGSRDRPLLDGPAVVPGAKVQFLEQHEGNNYPLTLSVDEYQNAIKLSIQAAKGIDPDAVLLLTRNAITSIVEALENTPDAPLNTLAVLTQDDEAALVAQWRGEPVDLDDTRCIHHHVQAQVEATPDRVAVRADGVTLTYRQLDAQAHALAIQLQEAGVVRGTVVGTCLHRSVEQIVALLAIFKVGGTYLPLDPDYPTERLNYVAQDSGCAVLLTMSEHASLVTAPVGRTVFIDRLDPPAGPLIEPGVTSEDVAYLLYTSGSTGRPKGVVGLHRMLTSRLLPERARCAGSEVYGQKSSINFIDSFWEVFLPLTTGATIQVVARDVARDPAELCQLINASGISHIVLVPTLLAAITAHLQAIGGNLPHLRYCVSSGEPLPLELGNRFRSVLPHVELVNIYGTTEFWDATTYVVRSFEPGSTVPIGLPMPGIGLYLLDEHQRPVPLGVDGELYVTSSGMGPGYVGRQDLTAKVFLPCPFEPGRSMYRTGDRVRWQPGIGLEYLGRTDRQLNVHGFRIEPSEIEAAMAEHPDVAEAVIMARGEDKHLAGYIVPSASVQAATMPFGLFYFSDAASTGDTDEMALYIESVKVADRLGFEAVWTPERHFTKVGASFPNPSVLSAAAAMVTQRVQLRSGSIVLPLHDPLRVAEEWSVVDRLSGGRVALSFASGWVPNDFVLAPDNFAQRHEVMLKGIEEVRSLWRGGTVSRKNGVGAMVDIGVQPRPVQSELPTWVTAAGAPQTFIDAGRIGANVLTHVLNTTIGGLAEKIAAYRKSRKEAGLDPATGKVAVMVHTYVTDDAAGAVRQARPHLENYFRSQLKLRKDVGVSLGLEVESDQDLSDEVITLAVDRFLATKALIGSPESCQSLVRELYEAGVDEIACLIDFGVPAEQILAQLPTLDRLRRSATRGVRTSEVDTWLRTRLPAYMLPQSVTVLDRLPLTPNGKIDRLALPDPAGTRVKVGHVAPRNAVEAELAAIWADVLRRETVGINDRFFDLGGNSVSAIRMINRAQKSFGIKISVRELFEKQTIAALDLGEQRQPAANASTPLIRLSHAPNAAPLFCIHGGTGEASYYAKLSARLGGLASVYAIQYPGLASEPAHFASLPELARQYIHLIQQVQPNGPYRLLGWSFGGLAAYEIARQLTAAGQEVSFLCMLDALIATGEPPKERWSDAQALFYMLKIHDLVRDAEEAAELERSAASMADGQPLLQRALEHLKQRQVYPDSARVEDLARNLASIKDVIHMSMHFRPDRYSGDVFYVGAMDDDHNVDEVVARWTSLVDGGIDLVKVDMRHNRMFDDAHIGQISAVVKQRLSLAGEALPG